MNGWENEWLTMKQEYDTKIEASNKDREVLIQ